MRNTADVGLYGLQHLEHDWIVYSGIGERDCGRVLRCRPKTDTGRQSLSIVHQRTERQMKPKDNNLPPWPLIAVHCASLLLIQSSDPADPLS
jgi:hypothetical protein